MSRTRRSDQDHLLPAGAFASERALSLAASFGDDILPEDIKNLWNLDKADARFLSFLAWGLHVDFWRDELNEAYKRELIGSSFAWHRKKGTPWAVKRVLADLGVDAEIYEWFDMGTAPHTFAVEAEFDYANSEPFAITNETNGLLLEAIEYTKPERSHLAYFSFVPKDDEDDDPDHRCIYDVCHFSHGYLWTNDLGITLLDELLRVIPGGEVFGYLKRLIYGSAAYQWSALYDAHRFGDAAFPPIEGKTSIVMRAVVGFADRGHIHRWHRRRSWLCGGTWKDDCCIEEISGTVLTFARSTGIYGGDASFGDLNNAYSGGVEEIVSHIGTFGTDSFSGREIEGSYYRGILEFTEHIERKSAERGFFLQSPEEVIEWES